MKIRILLLTSIVAAQAWALELPKVFSDHMVLQQGMPVRIWGQAKPGETIEVEFAGQKVSTRTLKDGSWETFLQPLEVSFESRKLRVSGGGKEMTFYNVLVGEVWLSSGQSNMQWDIQRSMDGDILLLGAKDPFLRMHQVNFAVAWEPRFSGEWAWFEDGANALQWFSAVSYQFARDLRTTLRVPVGVINSAVGGTPSIAWTRPEAIEANRVLREKNEEWEMALARYDEDLAQWNEDYLTWRTVNGFAEGNYDEHRKLGAPLKPKGPDHPTRPANLAHGMISPVAGFTIRGVIWYQGEEDANWDPAGYALRLRIMIKDWRIWWEREDLPFGIVQLANFQAPKSQPTNSAWANIRESQRRVALADPYVGLAVITDVGEANDIHPADKFTVARRLARWALTDIYGKLELRGGPEVVGASREGTDILIRFQCVGQGLHVVDQHKLGGFTASDSPKDSPGETDFYPVEAVIYSNEEVKLSIPEGKHPLRIRYGWQANPVDANLTNQERLPASPFQINL